LVLGDWKAESQGSRSGYEAVCRFNPAVICRSAYRIPEPWDRNFNKGFRVSVVLADTAPRSFVDADANKPSPAIVIHNEGSSASIPAIGSLIGPDGKWKLPPSGPSPAIVPFDAAQAKQHQESWAKHLGVPVEITTSIGMKLVLIPPGEFEMGSPKELLEEESRLHRDDKMYRYVLLGEEQRHRARITKPFWLGATVVTQEDYQRVMGKNPSGFSAMGEMSFMVAGQDTRRLPVENVSLCDAVEF
jgi:formylglycine-generating enzyme required for sulfatase activity